MNITSSNTMIFKKEDENGKVHYRASLSTKSVKGEYESGYIDVRMPKDAQIENKTKINITKGFLSFYNYKDKEDKQRTIWYVVVQEFNVIEQKKEQEVILLETKKAEEFDDLPF